MHGLANDTWRFPLSIIWEVKNQRPNFLIDNDYHLNLNPSQE